MIDIGSFLAERRYSTLVLLIALFITFLVLLISWPWVNVIFLALWAAYILWFPARWLERRIHRRVLSSFLVAPYHRSIFGNDLPSRLHTRK